MYQPGGTQTDGGVLGQQRTGTGKGNGGGRLIEARA